MMTDPIADCFSRIRNAAAAHHDETHIPHSKIKEALVRILKTEGLLSSVEVRTEAGKKKIIVKPRYDEEGKPLLQKLSRLSKPSHRIYRKAPTKMEARSGLGFQILSTSRGVMTDREAIEKKLGGELIAEIW